MKFVVLGTSELTIQSATALRDAGAEVQALFSMPEHLRPDNPADVAGFAATHRIDYHEVADINSPESVGLIRDYGADYVFCGWPKILKNDVLEAPRYFCIGSHPTALPLDRGRHPLHWLICLGITESKISLFRVDEGVDTGNVLVQVPYRIGPEDSIVEVAAAMTAATYEGILSLYQRLLADPGCSGDKQTDALANYWRKRTPHDVTLDLRMSSDLILRTVRSFAPPHEGANLIFRNHVIKIIRATRATIGEPSLGLDDQQDRHLEPGRIVGIEDNRIRVKADDAIVDLECGTPIPPSLLKAKYIHPPTKYLADWPVLLGV